jgi:hypothetical protein
MKKMLGILVCVAALAIAGSASAGPVTAFSPSVLNPVVNEQWGNDGEFFTPNTWITVTALGYASPGSIAGNQVGLYDLSTATLLASATILTTSTLLNNFHYESIVPVTLDPTHHYAVVGLYLNNGAVGYTADAGVGAASDITFDGYKYDLNGSLDIPTIGYAPPIFGPNFQYSVPDGGATLMLLGGALVGIGTLRRKFRG